MTTFDLPHPNEQLMRAFKIVDDGLAAQRLPACVCVHQFIVVVNPAGLGSFVASFSPVDRIRPVLEELTRRAASVCQLPHDWLGQMPALFAPEISNWWPYSPPSSMSGQALYVVNAPTRYMLVLIAADLSDYGAVEEVPAELFTAAHVLARLGDVHSLSQLRTLDPAASELEFSDSVQRKLVSLLANGKG